MNSENDTAQTLKNSDENFSTTPSVDALNRRLSTSPTPRMLTPYEIELLRQCADEVAQVTQEILASKENT